MNDSKKLKTVLVGCGQIAQTYLEAIQLVPAIRLTAIVDVDEKKLNESANRYRATAYKNIDEALANDNFDIAIVCVPPAFHPEVTLKLLDRNIHVLCEKPLSISSREAKEMVVSSENKNLVLMMASKFRYVDDINQAKQMINTGTIGDIILFENIFCASTPMENRWNSNPKISGGGVLIDNGTHSVDIIRFFFGSIRKVQAQYGKKIQAIVPEDTCQVYVRTESGVMGTIDLSWTIKKDFDHYIHIYGTRGTISIGWKGSRYRTTESSQWIPFGSGYNKIESFKKVLYNFTGSVLRKEDPVISAWEGYESVCVIEAAYESASRNKWIPVQHAIEKTSAN